jgi:hypothetical protein
MSNDGSCDDGNNKKNKKCNFHQLLYRRAREKIDEESFFVCDRDDTDRMRKPTSLTKSKWKFRNEPTPVVGCVWCGGRECGVWRWAVELAMHKHFENRDGEVTQIDLFCLPGSGNFGISDQSNSNWVRFWPRKL